MNLVDLTSELFLYLVVFRRKARAGEALRLDTVANDLEMIFRRMDEKAANDSVLNQKYQRHRRAIVAIADGIISGSEWDLALDYATAYLLENKDHHANTGGTYFFDELQKLGAEEADAREIFFHALALGFQGRLARQVDERMELKRGLYGALPGKLVRDEKITAQAYEHTDERDCTVAPVARFGRYAIILGGMFLFFLAVNRVVDDIQKDKLQEYIRDVGTEVTKIKGGDKPGTESTGQ